MDIYGLIGYPLKHSFSRKFFTGKFERENIDAQYLNFEIEDASLFPSIIEQYPNIKGLNVTIPYKEKVIHYLDDLDSQAAAVGAVNVIKIICKGTHTVLKGYNSDVIGFQNSIAPFVSNGIHKKALILGTGGASKAVKKGLENLGLETIYISRTFGEGRFLYSDIDENMLREYTVIVNTSPLGTYPDVHEAPDIPYHLLGTANMLYDLVYNPDETKFLRLGKKQGAVVKNGAEMLELQAIAAWEIWNSKI